MSWTRPGIYNNTGFKGKKCFLESIVHSNIIQKYYSKRLSNKVNIFVIDISGLFEENIIEPTSWAAAIDRSLRVCLFWKIEKLLNSWTFTIIQNVKTLRITFKRIFSKILKVCWIIEHWRSQSSSYQEAMTV